MKKTLLLLISLSLGQISFGQTFLTESFSGMTVGNVGTDLTGVTPGQGGWLTTSTNGAAPSTGTNADNSNFQIVVDPGVNGNVLQLTGTNGDKGTRFMWQPGLAAFWTSRTVGNDIIEVEYDLYTGAATTSLNTMRMYVYDATKTKVLAGFSFAMNTKILSGVAYYDNTANPGGIIGNYGFYLGVPVGTTPTNITYQANSWVRLGMSFNMATGQVKWKGPGFNPTANVMGAATGVSPDEMDIIASSGSNLTATPPVANAASAVALYDNIVVRASATDTLLGVDHVTQTAEFSLYPNPVKNMINITNPVSMQSMEIWDLNGRVVKTANLNNSNEASVDISELASGIYMVNIFTESGKISKKIIKN